MSVPKFWSWLDPHTLVLEILVQPGASKTEFSGMLGGRLKVRVKAIPENGKSNRELCQFLAQHLDVAPSCIQIIRGQVSRHKTLQVHIMQTQKLEQRLLQLAPAAQGELEF